MIYYLRSFAGRGIPLPDEEAAALNGALDATFAAIAFEELWDAVVQNFLDLERDVLRHALDDMVLGDRDWDYYQDMRTLFGRRLANLLSSCRAYIDHSPRELRSDCFSPDVVEQFISLRSQAYDQHFSYRLMEALRNYTQHRGSPITSTHLDARRIEQPAGDQFRHVTAASISAEKLRSDPKLKASIREELAGYQKLEVNEYARLYIERLGGIHLAVRTLVAERSPTAGPVILDAIQRVRESGADGDFGAYLIGIEGGEEHSRRALMQEPLERLDRLHRRNGSLQGLASRYVSGELLGANLR